MGGWLPLAALGMLKTSLSSLQAGICSESGQVLILALSLIPWGGNLGESQIIQLGVVQGEDSVLISACGGVFT